LQQQPAAGLQSGKLYRSWKPATFNSRKVYTVNFGWVLILLNLKALNLRKKKMQQPNTASSSAASNKMVIKTVIITPSIL
jgi:hypothetical protein